MLESPKLLVANWKMNKLIDESALFTQSVVEYCREHPTQTEVVICPPFTSLASVGKELQLPNINLGAQNCSTESVGAYTGEVSAIMLRDIGCKYVILGHSERRQHFQETNIQIAKKVTQAGQAGLKAIVCIGEGAEHRKSEQTQMVVIEQLLTSIPNNVDKDTVILAYEPIWAIGTSVTPSLTEINDMVRFVKEQTNYQYPVLYGGSVNAKNCHDIQSIHLVDGLLVGNASLDIQEFIDIIANIDTIY